jgi:hypothetical protein
VELAGCKEGVPVSDASEEEIAQEGWTKKKLTSRKTLKPFFIVLGSLIALVTLLIIIWYVARPKSPEHETANNPAYLTMGTDQQISRLKDAGVLYRISPQTKEAFIDGNLWSVSSQDMRENLGQTLAFYCGRKDGTGANWVIIKDWKSGRDLARYSEVEGMKIY